MIFVVAEIGVNWNGNYKLLEEMMRKAKDCNCNAVKFQCFKEKSVKNHPKFEQLMNSSISKQNIETVDGIAKRIGIEWFCTPMYPEAVNLLDPFVSRFKIRFSDGLSIVDNEKSEIFELILKTKKEVMISSEKSPKYSKRYNNSKIKWLYCVPKYPCSVNDLDFTNFKEFNGYSNHLPNIIGPLTASVLGSEIIEIHITPSKSGDFIDNPVSFDYLELEKLVTLIRLSEKIKK
jgi:sialic acid synthase SpsE